MILTNKKSINAGPSFGTGEGVAHSKRWYVALVRMHHEKKVSEYLDKMGIENFIPLQQEMHQWSDRRKLIESVLLPMMVFVHADPKERVEVLSLSTVSRYMVMRGESSPAVIPDDQMARFRFMLDYSDETVCMNSSPLARGEKVQVIKGPLQGLVGELVNVDGKSKIAVRLNMLGCACVDMPIGYVEPIGEKTKWVMTTSCLQEKIDKLQNTVHALLHKSNYMAGVYVDDLARLNNEIHEQINDLYPCHGKTAEQEAALCLSLLMGYSVSMYANSEDEAKKKTVLRRSQMILKKLSPTSLRFQLSTICNQF